MPQIKQQWLQVRFVWLWHQFGQVLISREADEQLALFLPLLSECLKSKWNWRLGFERSWLMDRGLSRESAWGSLIPWGDMEQELYYKISAISSLLCPPTSQAFGCRMHGDQGGNVHNSTERMAAQLLAANSAVGRGGLHLLSCRQDPTAFISCGYFLLTSTIFKRQSTG